VKELAERYGADELIVVFGLNEPANLRIMASTFKEGDPSYAGALGGVALGLASYHVLELKEHVPAEVWSEQMGMEELEIPDELAERVVETVRAVREG
jgi:betaine reductase